MGQARPPSAGSPSRATSADGLPPPPDPTDSPMFRRLAELLDRGEYAEAVLAAYQGCLTGTIRSYGLQVPVSCTDRGFLKELLRPDMGSLADLLPELYRRYEPVRFGTASTGDAESLRRLLRRIFSETVLSRLYDDAFQASGLAVPEPRHSRYDTMFRTLSKGGTVE